MRPCIPSLFIRQQNVSHPSLWPTDHEAAKPLGRVSLSRVPLCAPLPPYPLTTLLSRESLLGYPGSMPTHSSSLGELSDLDLPVTLPSTFLLTHSPLEPPSNRISHCQVYTFLYARSSGLDLQLQVLHLTLAPFTPPSFIPIRPPERLGPTSRTPVSLRCL
ncbi:hypothetical protein BDN71DRAFT_1511517 [Pleurotus eryngii]|uniref:Uncharacterized protein n=1 Tax=Pleurotus eryngii TaxID=5323 RepID=A0A9P5ZQT3_PLEER|nr:hypothetical protein BDN71DRAFT_1511517 [Pleurotus eryngii]